MMRSLLKNFWKDTRGQDLIEYALIAGFIAVAAVAVLGNVATEINNLFTRVASSLRAATGGS